MPTYDYECIDCGYAFEHFQSMSEPPIEECPSCKGKVRRLIGGGLGVIFKGSGFYVTDNKSAKQPTASPTGSSDNGGKESSKTDTSSSKEKTETKKEQPVKS